MGVSNRIANGHIPKLVEGIVKSGMTMPMMGTPVMPIDPFQDLLRGWPDNHKLSLALYVCWP